MVGSEVAARAPVDDYTLLLASNPNPNAISASLYANLSFNPVEDFAPITLLGREQAVLVAHPSLPAKNVQDLIALAESAGVPLSAEDDVDPGEDQIQFRARQFADAIGEE